MHRKLVRLVALLLVILGISPFTAPFSTCDLGTFGHESGNASTWFKAPADPNESLTLPTVTSLAAPLLTLVSQGPLRATDPISKHKPASCVLRV